MQQKSTLLGSSFRFLTGALLIIWLVLPLIPLAIWSFAKGWFYPSLLPKVWSLRAWEYTFSDTSGVLESLWLTVGISLAATVLSILVGVPAGRALGMYQFKGKSFIEMLILAPMIVPGIAVVLGLSLIHI